MARPYVNIAALGFAVQLCYLRYPGRVLAENETPPAALLGVVAAQLKVQPALWDEYAQRDETRRDHLIELQHLYGFQPFKSKKYREIAQALIPLGSFFAKAKRQFESAFQDAGRAINDKVRLYAKIGQALIEAKTSQSDPFLAIETVVPW